MIFVHEELGPCCSGLLERQLVEHAEDLVADAGAAQNIVDVLAHGDLRINRNVPKHVRLKFINVDTTQFKVVVSLVGAIGIAWARQAK